MAKEKQKKKPMDRTKKVRVMTVIIMILVMLCGWYYLFAAQARAVREYAEEKAAGDELFEKQIYDEAMDHYNTCLKTNPEDTDVLYMVAQIQYRREQFDSAVKTCEKILKLHPGGSKTLILEAKSLVGGDNVKKAIQVLNKVKDSEEAKELLLEYKGLYDLEFVTVSSVGHWFYTSSGGQQVLVKEGERGGVYTEAGKKVFSGEYTVLSALSEDGALYPVQGGEEFYFVDQGGERRAVPDDKLTALGTFRNGYAPASDDQKSGYLDASLKKVHFDYEATYPFSDGYALVRKDGKFQVIDTSFNVVSDCEFTNVLTDSNGFPCRFGVMAGQGGELWRLYDRKGLRIGTIEAEEFRLPEEAGGWIAFRKDGKWGFADSNGVVQIEPEYEDAKSFAEGYAPAKVEDKWGYIDTGKNMVIEPLFSDAGAMSQSGTAWVSNSAGYSLLKLKQYQS